MIDKNEIDRMSEEMQVHTSHVQRDYVHGWLLSHLYSNSPLANKLTLKGGNALRKGYFEQSRYSRDIDFTTTGRSDESDLGRELNCICNGLTERCGITFDTSRTIVEKKRRADKDKEISEARLYFTDFYGKPSKLVLGIRLDVTQFDRLYLPVQERNLIHPYSDFEACTTPIKCVKLEEILASKMRCLLQRKHIADLFDLVYAIIISPEVEIDRASLLSTFFKITIFGRDPSVVKGLFIDLPLIALGSVWEKYIACPVATFFDFERAKSNFFDFINELIPQQATHDYSRIFFPSVLRNPILAAADSMTMLKLRYSGIERLVEPYELAFKIRRDRVAREYFYAYDTTGGRHSPPGIKAFVSEKVESIENTDQEFQPRMPMEIAKAGGSENVSRFEGRGRSRSYFSKPAKRRVRTPRTQSSYNPYSYSPHYKIQCPHCGKKFNRKQFGDTKLNPHKDKLGNRCYGTVGFPT